jgi:hypothetical protein
MLGEARVSALPFSLLARPNPARDLILFKRSHLALSYPSDAPWKDILKTSYEPQCPDARAVFLRRPPTRAHQLAAPQHPAAPG